MTESSADSRETVTRRAGRPPVSSARIVAAATALIDSDGLDALTLRALAARMGSSTATLYRRFEDRAGLIDSVVDSVLGEVDLGFDRAAMRSWDDELSALAVSLFEVLERHRNVAPIMLERISESPNLVRIRERALALLLADGFSPRGALLTYATIGRYVLGFGVQTRIDTSSGDAASGQAGNRTDGHPATAAVSRVGAVSLAEEFRFGLEMIILGIRIGGADATAEGDRSGLS